MTFQEQLKNLNACEEAREWVQDKTLQEAFSACQRADWMLWAYANLYPKNVRELTLAKGHCVNTVRHLMRDERSIKAIDAAIGFGEGKIDESELDAAYSASADAYAAARAAACADAAAYVASYAAAYVAARAADDAYARAADDAADAASAAVSAAARAAADADAASAAYSVSAAAADAASARAIRAVAVSADAAAAAGARAQKQSLAEQADICRRYLTIAK